MIIDVNKNGVTYYGINEDEAISKGVHPEYLAKKLSEQHNEMGKRRRKAYGTESDPLYMEWQFDKTAEAEQAWRDKVAEIKARYPLPANAQY